VERAANGLLNESALERLDGREILVRKKVSKRELLLEKIQAKRGSYEKKKVDGSLRKRKDGSEVGGKERENSGLSSCKLPLCRSDDP